MDKAGNVHRYESVLVRRTYREGKKVRHETLANLSKLPAEAIAAIEATLKGRHWYPPRRRAPSLARCRTGMWPRSPRWPADWGFRACWARPADLGTWCWG